MTTTTDEIQDSRALAGLTGLYCDSTESPTPEELDRGLNQLFARVEAGDAHRRRVLRWSFAGATAALLVVVVLQVSSVVRRRWSLPQPQALAYRIDGGSVLEGGYLREAGHAGMKVLFNEGSTFVLAPGTRGRIRAVNRDGAQLAIEHGKASFQVTPSSNRRWLVDVGPFLVTVKGTAFSVSWDPLSEEFDLTLQRGRVVISGPVSAGEIALRAGQRLVVNLARAETVITEEKAEGTGVGSSGDAVSQTVPPAALPAPGERPSGSDSSTLPAPSASRTVGARRWGDWLARGEWDLILDDVKRLGVDTALVRASSDDLFALADAARYRQRPALARAALLAERRRFPESHRALDAIYLLGRVEESRERDVARAIGWYDEYLTRAPTGPFVGEALGRKMTLTEKLEGAARARPVAEEYLRRFPKGSYAGSARELIRAP
jgi:TolA-binding protein